jgi:serine/threonine-protein kinase
MLAKALEGSQHQALTRRVKFWANRIIWPPERTLHNGIVDSRSDIYGLGATCYALLTGRPPVAGENLGEILVNIRTAIPDPPKKYQLGIHELFQDIVDADVGQEARRSLSIASRNVGRSDPHRSMEKSRNCSVASDRASP